MRTNGKNNKNETGAGKYTVRRICAGGMFAALIAVLSLITVPMPTGVPVTLQTFGVVFAGVMLGTRGGALAVAVYLALGAAGLPVFSGFSGGLGALFGMTGGYLLAFPLTAFLSGVGAGKGALKMSLWIILGIVADYVAGTVFFMFVTGNGLYTSLLACVLPFIPADALKAALAGFVGIKCRKALARSGLNVGVS